MALGTQQVGSFGSVCFHIAEAQLREFFQYFDTDGSGLMDFEEFCVMLLRRATGKHKCSADRQGEINCGISRHMWHANISARVRNLKKSRIVSPETCSCSELWTPGEKRF